MNKNADKKILSYLSLAARARKLVSGEFSADKAVKEGKAWLVIIAGDASENTKKSMRDACEYRHVQYIEVSDKSSLGHAIGKEERALLALTDKGFADAIRACLDDGGKTY